MSTPHPPAGAIALAFLGLAATAEAQSGSDARTLDRVVVEATRLHGVDGFDTPASVTRIDLGEEANGANAQASERLAGVPGVLARERQNHAQDTQLSIRGFGARSTFGVRGVRLYADGIPATQPDGQGQLSHFNLAAGDRIEVMRGPFSALYGNSSGGVVQITSAEGTDQGQLDARLATGSHDSHGASVRWLGKAGRAGFNLAASLFDTQGYRDHSAARRESANARIDVDARGDDRLMLVFNHLDIPHAQDPLGLTRAQVDEDPRQATSVATQFDTRKSVRQDQAGAVYAWRPTAAHTVTLSTHAGQREVEQFLALPVAAQGNPLNSGGVIDLDNDYAGADLRWAWQGEWWGRAAEWTMGAETARLRQHRRGYENHAGGALGALGVRGALRRDERNRVESIDQYLQAWWQVAPRWSLLAGARHGEVRFRSQDHYVTASNPDDSGRVRYGETTPVAGVVFHAADDLRLYLSAGRGFETPTFNELGYRADGGAGLALDLRAAVSRNLETGLKWRTDGGTRLEAALFRADTDDELAVASNVGGRSTYRNVGRARRQGFEAMLETPLDGRGQLQLAYTRLQAEFRDGFLVCAHAGCAVPDTPVAAGTRIPGVPRDQLFARVEWPLAQWRMAAEGIAVGDVGVNDLGTESAPGYMLLHLELSRRWTLREGGLRGFARIDNMLDQRYIGSVIVNEGNSRFHEPGPARTFLLGLEWNLR